MILSSKTQNVIAKLILNGNVSFEHSDGRNAHNFKDLLGTDFVNFESAIEEGVNAGCIYRNGVLDNNPNNEFEYTVVLDFEKIIFGDYLTTSPVIPVLRANMTVGSRNYNAIMSAFTKGMMALELEKDGFYAERNELSRLSSEAFWCSVRNGRTREENLKLFLELQKEMVEVIGSLPVKFHCYKDNFSIKQWKQDMQGNPIDFFSIYPRFKPCLCGSGKTFKNCCM